MTKGIGDGTNLEKPCRCNDNNQSLCQVLNLRLERRILNSRTDTSATLQRMRHKHAVIRQELAALDDIVAAAADEGGAHDAHNFGEEVVVLLKRARVARVDLQLRVRGEET